MAFSSYFLRSSNPFSMSTDEVQTQAALAANKLASTAVGISIAAFIVAYLQFLFGNLMSGNALWKTSHAAIGVTARHRSWRLGVGRVKILYPQVDFKIIKLLAAGQISVDQSIESSFLSSYAVAHGLEWRRVRSGGDVSSAYVSDGFSVLFNSTTQERAKPSDLPFSISLRYWLWRLRHPVLTADRPRATWAQMIQAFGLTDASELVVDSLDADTIPSGIDVPIQRTRLAVLGRIALILGCTRLDMNAESRHFHASGPSCTISVEEIPTFGKVARFEGDIYALNGPELRRCSREQVTLAMHMTTGHLALGPYLERSLTHIHLIYRAITGHWSKDKVEDEAKRLISSSSFLPRVLPGHYVQEADAIPRSRRSTAWNISSKLSGYRELSDWQELVGITIPTVLVMTMMSILPCAFCGFPSGVFLTSVSSWCGNMAADIMNNNEALDIISLSPEMQESAARQEIPFLDPRSRLLMDSRSRPKSQGYSWLFGRLRQQYAALPPRFRETLCSSRPQKRRSAYNVKILVMPLVRRLFARFEPVVWAETLKKKERDMRWKLYPINILWLQTVLLDIAIRIQIKGSIEAMDECDRWTMDKDTNLSDDECLITEGKSIVKAITESYYLDGKRPEYLQDISNHATSSLNNQNAQTEQSKQSTFRPWNLERALMHYCDFYADMDPEQAELEYRRLAIMLKLRSLVFFAFLMVGPDSSQLYESRASLAQIPIV
ncbi:hypothetical protein CC78DRAFT_608891 [Lojkania enalia]|uniref:Uncharacterized protein n=1 Tax=Lojkania enalia TaxID=147567 RepID=A0A9P4K6M7_9PLEO|nr:hypothetical protein CC78DRAFT_608891 [Didymosphaeria enalia]